MQPWGILIPDLVFQIPSREYIMIKEPVRTKGSKAATLQNVYWHPIQLKGGSATNHLRRAPTFRWVLRTPATELTKNRQA